MNEVITLEEVQLYLEIHNKICEKLCEIIDLYSEIDDRQYVVTGYETDEHGFHVDLEYYKYQDTHYNQIYVKKELLLNTVELNALKDKAHETKQTREKLIEDKRKDQLEQRLRQARELLAEYA